MADKNSHIPLFFSHAILAIPKSNNKVIEKGVTIMSSKNSNQINIPEARSAMDKFKMEAATDLDVSVPS